MNKSLHIDELRNLYFRYGCSWFHMLRDGFSEEYQRIPEEKKKEWTLEYRKGLLSKLEADPCDGHIASRFLGIISPEEVSLVDDLLTAIEKNQNRMDSFSKILVSEEFLDWIHKRRLDENLNRKERMLELGILLLEGVRKEPESIDGRYKELSYIAGMLDENAIIERASKSLNKLEGMRTRR